LPVQPEVIVMPVNTKMVSHVLKFANKHKIPVTPRGAGTGLSGGAIPIYGGILLSLEKMDRILKIDDRNFVAVVEAGVSLSTLNECLTAYNLYYPIRFGDMSATIGGNIATNAGGMNAVKYGVTRHHVLGIEAVLANGDIIESGGAYVKSSTGYDLTRLLTGSEGTLAIITKIILRLMPLPGTSEILLAPFSNLQNAIDTVPELLRLKTIPMGLEFLEKDIVKIVEKHTQIEMPYDNSEAFLMIIMEGNSSEEIIQYFCEIEEICRRHGAIEFLVPGDERAKRRLTRFREKIHESMRRERASVLLDVVVPRSEIARFVKKVRKIANDFNIPVISFGHAGDGNIHLYPIRRNQSQEDWDRQLLLLITQIFKAGKSLGGTISGEHGIGSEKKRYLPLTIDGKTLSLMQRIKLAFDPNNILNPGKIFDN
jgi:glycolate oxidase